MTEFIETPVTTKPSKTAVKKHNNNQIDQFGTGAIVWHLVKRHKFGLVAVYAAVLTVAYTMPFLPSVVVALIAG